MISKNSIFKFQLVCILFTFIVGTLLHFTFEWSKGNTLVASFSAVNESTWEHLKLAFYPMLLITIIGLFYFYQSLPSFLCAKTIGIITAISFITIFFYTYTGILGTNFAFLDIGSFFVAVLLGEYVSYKIMVSSFSCYNLSSGIILALLLACFVTFTYFPPKLNYFKDPVTNSYGLNHN